MNEISNNLIIFSSKETPIQSDHRYEDWRNPNLYTQATDIRIEEGDFLLPVKIRDPEDQNDLTALPDECRKKGLFPSYLPLRVLIRAEFRSETNLIILEIFNQTFRFQSCYDYADFTGKGIYPVKIYSANCKDTYLSYPDQNQSFPLRDYCRFQFRLEKVKFKGKKSLALMYEKIFEAGNQRWPLLKPEAIEARFTEARRIEKGKEGIVFEVRDTKTQTLKALKISTNAIACTGYFFPHIKYIIENELTPHLTAVEEAFRVKHKKSPYGTAFPHSLMRCRCYVMELLEGDLQRGRKMTKAFKVQHAATLHLLQRYHVYTQDSISINILYKKLEDTDLFRGKKLNEYDYWKYTIDHFTFYIPKQELLIKLCDYDKWESNLFSWRKQKKPEWLQAVSFSTLERLAVLFSKPEEENVSVLEIS